MKTQNYTVTLSAFIGGFIGVFFALSITNADSFAWNLIWATYWSVFLALMITLIDATLRFDYISLYSVGRYSCSMGCLGSFLGLFLMCKNIATSINAGSKDAILEELSGFSICLITSIVGMVIYLLSSILAALVKDMKEAKS